MQPMVITMLGDTTVNFISSIILDRGSNFYRMTFAFEDQEKKDQFFCKLRTHYRMEHFAGEKDFSFMVEPNNANQKTFFIYGNLLDAIEHMLEWKVVNLNIKNLLIDEDLVVKSEVVPFIKESSQVTPQNVIDFTLGKPVNLKVNSTSNNRCGFPLTGFSKESSIEKNQGFKA